MEEIHQVELITLPSDENPVTMGTFSYPTAMDMKLDYLKSVRQSQLDKSDKYMLSDFPITEEKREEWKVYRQAIRDLPENKNLEDLDPMDPNGVNWPTEPTP